MKRRMWIGAIIAVAVCIRVLFYLNYPGYQTTGDSVTYYLTGKSMRATRVFADQWRTPVYPMIIALPYILEGKAMPEEFPYLSYEFIAIRVAQSVAGIIALIILFYLLMALGVRETGAGWYCLFMACNRTLMVFEHQLLTESFSLFCLLCIVFWLVKLMKTFSWRVFFMTSILSIFVVFLRPSYIALPLVVSGLVGWRYWRRQIVIAVGAVSVVYASLLIAYMQTNATYYKYQGISRISDVNLLGKILTYKLPIDTTPDTTGVKQIIGDYLSWNPDPNPWSVFRSYPQLYTIAYAKPLGDFVHAVVRNNIGTYFVRATREIPASLIDVSGENEIAYSTKRFEWLFSWLNSMYYWSQYINLIILVAAPYYILAALRKKNAQTSGYMVLSIVALYHIAFAVYLGYADFARHLSVVQPLLYFLSFSFIAGKVKHI